MATKVDAVQGDRLTDLENRLEAVKDYQRQIASAMRAQDYGRAAELKKEMTLAAEGHAGASSAARAGQPGQAVEDRRSTERPPASEALRRDLDRSWE